MTSVRLDARSVRWALGAVTMFAPMLIVALGPRDLDPFLVYLGLLPALVALPEGSLVALVTAVATPVVVAAGVLCSGSPWLGTTYLALAGVGVAWSWSRGVAGAGTYVASQAALGTISPPAGVVVPGNPPLPEPVGLVAVLVGGLWVVVVGRLLLRDLPVHRSTAPTRGALVRFAVVLTGLVAVATAVTMSRGPGLHAWWVVLSLLVIVQPDRDATLRRAVGRVVGTTLGGAGAALLVVTAGRSLGTAVLGLVLGVASAAAYLKAAYWVFTTLLTAALVLLTFPAGTLLRGEAERIGFTVVAAAAVMVVGLAWETLGAARAWVTTPRASRPLRR